jgi:hypothetical protein
VNKQDGVLQKFIQPKGEHNFVIKVVWSPMMCFLEKRENNKRIQDEKLDLYERAVTMEAKEYQCTTTPLRGYLIPNSLEKLTEAVAKHVRMVTSDQADVKRLCLIFKMDPQERLWFLYCSSLRCDSDDVRVRKYNKRNFGFPIRIENTDIEHTVPHKINIEKFSHAKPRCFEKIYTCTNCEKILDPEHGIQMKYEHIIKGFDSDKLKNFVTTKPTHKISKSGSSFHKSYLNSSIEKPQELEIDEYNIPDLLRKIIPRMRLKDYQLLKNQPGFLNTLTIVCEDCYMQCTKSLNFGGDLERNAEQVKNTKLSGTGHLNPQSLSLSRERTMKNIREIKGMVSPSQTRVSQVTSSKSTTTTKFFPRIEIRPPSSKYMTHLHSYYPKPSSARNSDDSMEEKYKSLTTDQDFFKKQLEASIADKPNVTQYSIAKTDKSNSNSKFSIKAKTTGSSIQIVEDKASNRKLKRLLIPVKLSRMNLAKRVGTESTGEEIYTDKRNGTGNTTTTIPNSTIPSLSNIHKQENMNRSITLPKGKFLFSMMASIEKKYFDGF